MARARKEEETPLEDEAPVSPVEKPRPLSRGREVAAILLFASALLSALSLVSFNPYDPGPFSFGTVTVAPRNWVGILGSYASSLLIHLFGLTALYVPICLGRLGVMVLSGRSLFRPDRYLLWLSLMLSQGTFLQRALGTVPFPFPSGDTPLALGGVVAIILGELMERSLGPAGAVVVLLLWVVLSLALFFRISPIGLMRRALSPLSRFWDRLSLRREQRRQEREREAVRDQIRQKQKERDRPPEGKDPARPVKISQRAPAAPSLPLEPAPEGGFRLPPSDLLDPPRPRPPVDEEELREKAGRIEARLREFDIAGDVVEIHPGPVVTIFEFKLAPGVKYARMTALEEDLALALKADHVRVDRVSGKSHVGIEVPNEKREVIAFRELIESRAYADTPGKLPLALGKTVDGLPFVTTLDRMPHLLVAGTTGSGKSVGINALIHSILFRSTPDEVKFILVDPKQVELKIYEGLPHLMVPVVTDVKKAANALNWAVREMTERYKLLAGARVRSIDQYNAWVRSLTPRSAQESASALNRPLPYIVIVIDELYDLMAAVAKEVETAIARLSAMARAVGIHLILATQRPSRDVITGVIKSNLPARLAFQVREKLESRLILDQNGAETLEGKGDMLFLPPGSGRLVRLHGGFLSTTETQRVLQYLTRQAAPTFDTEVLKETPGGEGGGPPGEEGEAEDPLYRDAVRLVVQTGVASASNLQRRMRIGYARAARLLDVMEKRGLVGPADGAKPREIFVTLEEVEE